MLGRDVIKERIDHGTIAKIPFVRRGDSAYVVVEGPTWVEAQRMRESLVEISLE